jgi:hypothetical protein
MIHNDILYPLVLFNFGPEAARQYTPNVSLGDFERRRYEALLMAVATLLKTGDLTEEQKQVLYEMIAVPRGKEKPPEPMPLVQPGQQPGQPQQGQPPNGQKKTGNGGVPPPPPPKKKASAIMPEMFTVEACYGSQTSL